MWGEQQVIEHLDINSFEYLDLYNDFINNTYFIIIIVIMWW